MNLKIKNLVKVWFFPKNNAIILSSKGDLIVCDMKNRRITHFPTDMECIKQLTITEDYLIYGDYNNESEEYVKIYEYPSLHKVRDSTLFDLTCPTFQITNYKNMFFAIGDEYSVVLINPLTDEIVKEFPLPEEFHIDDIFLSTFNYNSDYLVAYVEYTRGYEIKIPKEYMIAWDSRKNYIKNDEDYYNGFNAIWEFHSCKFHAVIGSGLIVYDLPIITKSGWLIASDTIFDIKDLKLIHRIELLENHHIIGVIDDYLITLNEVKRNELAFYTLNKGDPVHIYKSKFKIFNFVNNSRYVMEYKDYKAGEFPNLIHLQDFLTKLK